MQEQSEQTSTSSEVTEPANPLESASEAALVEVATALYADRMQMWMKDHKYQPFPMRVTATGLEWMNRAERRAKSRKK